LLLQAPPHISLNAKISPRYKKALGIITPEFDEDEFLDSRNRNLRSKTVTVNTSLEVANINILKNKDVE
jgi:hypothetical protein